MTIEELDEIIRELRELQEKAVQIRDIATIQLCIDIVKKHKGDREKDET